MTLCGFTEKEKKTDGPEPFSSTHFVMQKTNFPFEVLINDDASTDKTPEIIKEYAEKQGLSLNAYINLAIDERMEKDENSPPPG